MMKPPGTDPTSTLESLFLSPVRGPALFAAARTALYGKAGIVTQLSHQAQRHGRPGFDVMQAGLIDGYDVMAAQQMWGLFSPSRSARATAWAVERMRACSVLGTVRDVTLAARQAFGAAKGEPEPSVVLVPADPSNHNLMVCNAGFSAFGGLRDSMVLEIWPSDGNLARLPACVARAAVHNAFWRKRGRATAPTLLDFVVLEGIACEVISTLTPRWRGQAAGLCLQHPDGWQEALEAVAELCGRAAFADVAGNIYGSKTTAPAPLSFQGKEISAAEISQASAFIKTAQELADPIQIAAYLYGDEAVARHGHATVGMPPLAGFHVGQSWVGDYRREYPSRPLIELAAEPWKLPQLACQARASPCGTAPACRGR